jgi:hypothetical protein
MMDGGEGDAGFQDAGAADAGEGDGGRMDAGGPDSGSPDAGTEDAGRVDAGGFDAGMFDGGGLDAGTFDAGHSDAGHIDAGNPDAGAEDAGMPDAGARDAGFSDAGTTARVPAAPTGVMATPGNGHATVSWTPPSDNGGSAILSYTVTASPGAATSTTVGATTTTISGLTDGQSYTFTVHATNAVGSGPESAPSAAIIPAGPPGAPTQLAGVSGDGQVTVSWTAAPDDGSAITGYTVTASPGGAQATTTGATSVVVSGLTNGQPYTFTAHATNALGNGPESAPSASVTPGAVPDAPTNVTGVAGNGQVTVSWTAPANTGGNAITGYTVTSNPGNFMATTTGALSATVSGLTNGQAYTFTVFATNAVGNGAVSAPSAAVTPVTVPGAPTGVTASGGTEQATVSWTAPAGNGGSAILHYTVTASPGGATVTATGTTTATFGVLRAGTYTFTVTATNAIGTGPASSASGSATVQAGAPVASTSSIVGSPSSVSADGRSIMSLVVTVSDAAGDALPNVAVVVRVSGAGNVLTRAKGTTGGLGTFTAQLSSTVAGTKVAGATVGSFTVSSSVTFTSLACSGTFSLAAAGTSPAAGSAPTAISSGFFNADSHLDLAVANNGDSTVSILLGDGSGGFSAGTPLSATSPSGLFAADLQGNGDFSLGIVQDPLAFPTPPPSTVRIYLGGGTGAFSNASGSPFSDGANVTALAFGDLDGDGIVDLAGANFASSSVSFMRGDGSGGFSAFSGSPFSAGPSPQAVAVADFNNDGRLDVVVVDYDTVTSGEVTVLLGNGSGGVSSSSVFATGAGPLSVAVGDFNGDGDLDMAVANGDANSVSILLGNGSGGFSAGTPLTDSGAPNTVVTGDFNGDGHVDLAVVNGSGSVSVFLGSGSGGFTPASGSPYAAGAGADGAVAGDFNEDGRLDLAVSNNSDDNVTVLLNRCQ